MKAYDRGFIAGLIAAAEIADEYASVNIEMAQDTILADPVLADRDFSPTALEKSKDLQIHGCIHSSMFHAAQNIAGAIRETVKKTRIA